MIYGCSLSRQAIRPRASTVSFTLCRLTGISVVPGMPRLRLPRRGNIMSGLKLLKSYNFTDKDPVIDKMRSPVKQSELSYAQISEKSGVSASTIYNWFEGTTKRPQYATVVAVMRVLGYKEAFV